MSLTSDDKPDAGFWLAAASELLRGRIPGSSGDSATDGSTARDSTLDVLVARDMSALGPGGWLPKASACLIRLALETGIEAFWVRVAPAVAGCRSRRAQLLMLRRRAGRDLARRITYAWVTLSRFTHCQCYDPAPTAAELSKLHVEVAQLLQALIEVSETPALAIGARGGTSKQDPVRRLS